MAQTQTSAPRVLYRKYRPTKLEDVVGQSAITKALAESIKQGKPAHAYLFIGPRGTGKTSVARIFAHAVNHFDYQVEDSYLDIIEIDAASNTGVDNIRELREKSIIAPTKGKYKVYIIDEIHMLTKSAANALLKTLEEPPEHVIFIMATTDAHKVPITISSRAQVYTFQLSDPETMFQHLRKIADQEGIKITDEALQIVVRRGGGSFRDSLSLLDQIATLSDAEITAEILNQALGLPTEQLIEQLLTAYKVGDSTSIQQILHDFLNLGLSPTILASEIIARIVEQPEPPLLPLLAKLPEIQAPFPEAKLLLAFLDSQNSIQAPQNSATTPQKAPEMAKTAQKTSNLTSEASETAKTTSEAPETTPKSVAPSHPTPDSKAPETPPVRSEGQSAPKSFSWEDLLAKVHDLNAAIHNQLQKVDYEVKNGALHLYPAQKFTKNILDKPGNRQLLAQVLPDTDIIIHEVDEPHPHEDPALSQISAIMGGIQEVKDDLPF